MKRTTLAIAAAALIAFGAASPSKAASNSASDETAAAIFTLAVGTIFALASDSDHDYVHYRPGRGHDRYNRGAGRYDPKLERCLRRAYRKNNSPRRCYRKAEERYYKQYRWSQRRDRYDRYDRYNRYDRYSRRGH